MTTFGSGTKWAIGSLAALTLATATLTTANLAHTETGLGRHKKTFAVPTPGKVVIDGTLDDWDLSGQIEMFVMSVHNSGQPGY